MAYFSMRAGVHLMQKKKITLKKLNRLKSKKSFQIVYVKGRTVVDAMSVFIFSQIRAKI